MRAAAALILFAALAAHAQSDVAAQAAAQKEQEELSKAIAEAGGSPVDFTRALEKHLEKYPQTAQRAQIEKALASSAVEANDRARVILYGERVLKADPKNDDMPLIDHVTRALLDTDDPEAAKRALDWVKRYQAEIEEMRPKAAQGHMSEGQWNEEIDRARARAMVLEARATGNTGHAPEALEIALNAWNSSPGAETAREVARWHEKLGHGQEAIGYYAKAFTTEDSRTTSSDRARDRVHLAELYQKLHGSEKGLGDLVLAAYDEMAGLQQRRLAKLKQQDPNAGAKEVSEFRLPGVGDTESLSLASLKGKAVVMDFWATWCAPCRVQHPMIENVKKRYTDSDDVVFLSIDSDEDPSIVPAFLRDMKWGQSYLEAGLQRALNISSIPTIIVLDKRGQISSRMAGFIPERFEDMLSQRIDDARRN